ncbi:hypothetical protein B0T17DRAFT_133485 [Bombardia bombarda]|uniref:Uncharacterized protein n=1 Tax=Bombardia bombarda TaxID=252184 RepID=A0AA39TG81_9PEZI|nr:hypothetical protein B0T17DRAFT_133485 [Bombardia bombarda]
MARNSAMQLHLAILASVRVEEAAWALGCATARVRASVDASEECGCVASMLCPCCVHAACCVRDACLPRFWLAAHDARQTVRGRLAWTGEAVVQGLPLGAPLDDDQGRGYVLGQVGRLVGCRGRRAVATGREGRWEGKWLPAREILHGVCRNSRSTSHSQRGLAAHFRVGCAFPAQQTTSLPPSSYGYLIVV